MLFNSTGFLLLFLPLVLVVFFLLAARRHAAAIGWLILASLFFYGWWDASFLLVLAASLVVGFGIGLRVQALRRASPRRARLWVAAGVALHLAAIAWYKYAGFLAGLLTWSGAGSFELASIAMPLAISFFTFQQIAFLVDCGRGLANEKRFSHYVLFILFFPQLISGPIVHHHEMIPQFDRPLRFRWDDFSIGLAFLAIGLFKKVVLADGIAAHSSPVYAAAARGVPIGLWAGWTAGLGYTLQLYFDFSGYSDMAVGLGRLFGIRLPFNFHSPLKSGSIIEFWRRWHMTLSRFLRDYLYVPLGGGRRGALRRWLNLMLTMLLGGLWHGAAWTFVLWGGMHGLYLGVNHLFRGIKARLGREHLLPPVIGRPLAVLGTFLAVMVAFVLFRAENVLSTISIVVGMLGLRGTAGFAVDGVAALWIAALLAIAWGLPNSQQWLARHDPGIDPYGHLEREPLPRFGFAPTPAQALLTFALFAVSLYQIFVEGHVEFLYRFF